MYKSCKNYINELVTIVEWRHIFGCLHDEDGPVSIDRELDIFYKVEKLIQARFPLFRMKIIVCGLKMLGKSHIQAMLDAIESRIEKYNMISAFDMVNEEDYNEGIDYFLEQILETKKRCGDKF